MMLFLLPQRSANHLKELLGDKYEAARVKMKNPDDATPRGPKGAQAVPKAKAKAVPKAKATKGKASPAKAGLKSKKLGKDNEDEDNEDAQEGDEDEEEGDEDTKPPPTKHGRRLPHLQNCER